jgi:hypothetical protein
LAGGRHRHFRIEAAVGKVQHGRLAGAGLAPYDERGPAPGQLRGNEIGSVDVSGVRAGPSVSRASIGFSMRHALCFFALMTSVSATALTFRNVDYICPVGGEAFSSPQVGSATYFGMNLDTRPEGMGPVPWPLPKCPGNGFVIFAEKFPEDELSKLTQLVGSPEYQALRNRESDYFLAAFLMERIERPARSIAYTLLNASWEAQKPEQEQRYLDAALRHYLSSLDAAKGTGDELLADQFLAGELERRLGKFSEAESRFKALLVGNRLSDEGHIRVARYQLELIGEKDSLPHGMPAPPK